jgi:glycosyltransferase-like protein
MTRRIAILTHSTNPRGGVVHAMHLAEALCDLGEEVTLVAPALPGQSFFRLPRCAYTLVPAAPALDTPALVAQRIGEIAHFLTEQRFDLHHAQDPIGANALADLREAGRISGFLRTVHHLEPYADAQLNHWQDRGWQAADHLLAVSDLWEAHLTKQTARPVTRTGNGVDPARYQPLPGPEDDETRRRLRLPSDPFLLAFGGVEARKNTSAILRAFLALHREHPNLSLVVAGGASLLDHRAAQQAFAGILAEALPQAQAAVRILGTVPDADMPSLYRACAALVSPSLMEGFGLCPVEAMACGRPVIVSAIAPFTEHLGRDEVLWADPADDQSILAAMRSALDPLVAQRLSAIGPDVAAAFSWTAVAAQHRDIYASFLERQPVHA